MVAEKTTAKREYIELRTIKVKAEKRYSSTKGIQDVHVGLMKGEFRDGKTGHVVKVTLNFEATNLELLSTVMPVDVLTTRHLKLMIPDSKLEQFQTQPDKNNEPQASINQFLPQDDGGAGETGVTGETGGTGETKPEDGSLSKLPDAPKTKTKKLSKKKPASTG